MSLETCRTILRRFEKKDLEDLNDYCSQDGNGTKIQSKLILSWFLDNERNSYLLYVCAYYRRNFI